MDAIRIVSVLSLPRTAVDFRRNCVLWSSWLERLSGISGPDVRAEFLSTLALTQRLVEKTDTEVDSFGLEPLWLKVCGQSGNEYPSSYLSIGLLGLRLLPEREGVPSERPWMSGLARWATAQKPELPDFSRQWWALRALYPQAPGYWRYALTDTLRQESIRSLPAPLLDFWKQDIGLRENVATSQAKGYRSPWLSPSSREAFDSILQRAGEPLYKIAAEVRSLEAGHERYAEATGDSFLLVRTSCAIGNRLLATRESDDIAARGRLAVELARKAMIWQPSNSYAWSLWRDGLEAQGEFDAAEHVGWDAIRRLPEHVWQRTQLALLLTRLPDRLAEAEMLLRETIDRFPTNPVARNQLAEVLIALNQSEKAEGIIAPLLAERDAAIFDLQARLAFHSQGAGAARDIISEGLEQFPSDSILLYHLDQLMKGKGLALDSAALRPIALSSQGRSHNTLEDSALKEALRGGQLRRLATSLPANVRDAKWRSKAIEDVRQALAEDPNLTYALSPVRTRGSGLRFYGGHFRCCIR